MWLISKWRVKFNYAHAFYKFNSSILLMMYSVQTVNQYLQYTRWSLAQKSLQLYRPHNDKEQPDIMTTLLKTVNY